MKKKMFLLIVFLLAGCQSEKRIQTEFQYTIPHTSIVPICDGIGNEACWNIDWIPMDQVWMPYGETVSADDYSGRFKVTWSSKTNLLYFLVEVEDDVFVDGHDPDKKIPGVHEYDIIEIFIDENASGGLHLFNGDDETAEAWGVNAWNAIAHHIYADIPEEGTVNTEFASWELAGTNWDNARQVNYAAHFDAFALGREGNRLVYELALRVYDESYNPDKPEASRSTLAAGKSIGLTLAYCDNDDASETPVKRDHFFGSVPVTEAAQNDHWMNADDFGKMILGE